MLALSVLVAGTTAAWGQQDRLPPLYLPDEGYQTTHVQAPTSETYLVSTNAYNLDDGQRSLEDEVAELKAWKQQVVAREAAAKKKAANSPTLDIGG